MSEAEIRRLGVTMVVRIRDVIGPSCGFGKDLDERERADEGNDHVLLRDSGPTFQPRLAVFCVVSVTMTSCRFSLDSVKARCRKRGMRARLVRI